MSILSRISTILGVGAVLGLTLMFGLTSSASADCMYQYNANGFNTSSTPVFNNICGVPNIGDEANFVRIRADVNGNDEDNQNNPAYSIGTINSSCTTGDKFDVWNYVHNNASQNDNPDVGSGSAVANGVYINMHAPINTTNSKFTFNATVGASNSSPSSVTSMTPAVLDCNGKQVQLSLVAGTVNEYSEYGQALGSWTNLSQNAGALNTNLPLGSTNAGASSANSGTQWGCFNYRIVVVYQVEVTPVPPVQTPPTCNLLDLEVNGNIARIDNIEYTANDANVTGFSLKTVASNGTNTTQPIGLSGFPVNINLTPGVSYTFTASVLSKNFPDQSGPHCVKSVSTPNSPTPPPATPPATTPTALVNTGPGSVVAIFLAASAFGTGAYHWLLKKRLAKK